MSQTLLRGSPRRRASLEASGSGFDQGEGAKPSSWAACSSKWPIKNSSMTRSTGIEPSVGWRPTASCQFSGKAWRKLRKSPRSAQGFVPQQVYGNPVALLDTGQTALIRTRPAERHRVALVGIYHIPGLLDPKLDELRDVTPHLTSLPLLARGRVGVGEAHGGHGDLPNRAWTAGVDPRQPFVEISHCNQAFVMSTLPPLLQYEPSALVRNPSSTM